MALCGRTVWDEEKEHGLRAVFLGIVRLIALLDTKLLLLGRRAPGGEITPAAPSEQRLRDGGPDACVSVCGCWPALFPVCFQKHPIASAARPGRCRCHP